MYMCILFFCIIYVLLLTRFHHVHISLLFLFISSYVCNDLSEIENMFCSKKNKVKYGDLGQRTVRRIVQFGRISN